MPNITTNHAITYTNYRWYGVSHRGTFFHLKHFAKSEFFGLGYFTKSILVGQSQRIWRGSRTYLVSETVETNLPHYLTMKKDRTNL